MPPAVIRHLRNENIIKSEKDGVAIIFDKESIEEFQKDFNRSEYLTKSECDKKIRPFVTAVVQPTKNPKTIGINISPVGIYISGVKLITGSAEIPDEYRLHVREFGLAKYITRKSLAKTLNWLRNLYNKKNPRVPYVDWANTESNVKRSVKKRKMRLTKRITKSLESEVEKHKRWVEEMKRERKEGDEQFMNEVGFGRLNKHKRSIPPYRTFPYLKP
jgi:hypothetical protein